MNTPFNYITKLRAVATLCVILLHVVADTLYEFDSTQMSNWHVANILDGMVRFCVPIFVVISGILLFKKTDNFKEFGKKRIEKVIVPFLFWFLLYFSFDLLIALKNNTFYSLDDFFVFQIQKGSGFHFWYIYMIICVYLLIFIFSHWIINATRNQLTAILFGWLLIIMLLQFLNTESMPYLLSLGLKVLGYFGYAILGYFIHNFIKFPSKKGEFLTGLLFFTVGGFATLILTYYASLKIGQFEDLYYEYLTLNVALQTLGFYFMFRSHSFISSTVSDLSRHSYGIYLIHPLMIVFILKLNLDHYISLFLVSKLLITLLAILGSFYAIKIMNKIPFLKRFVG